MALFAALAYAVTQSGRGGGSISKETALLDASKIVQYAGAVGQAVIRMRLAAGCSETQVSFENASEGGAYVNAGAPADKSCHVFDANGGGVSWQKAPAGSNNGLGWLFQDGLVVHTRDGSNSTQTEANVDLVMLLVGLPQSVCEAINNGLGITGVPVDKGSIGAHPFTYGFTGAYEFDEDLTGKNVGEQPSPCITAPGTGLCGKLSGCFKEEIGGQRYIFYNVLISR